MANEAASPSSQGRGSSSDEQEPERPERMRDWLIRMINSKRFPGLEWLDPEKTIFKVPWIHAKKRGYNRERDAALFKEWAIHSGKYRDESDPTVWKINFRCAINGLKDIIELKDLQTEDCRVYKVLPRTRPPKRRRRSLRSSVEPYPTGYPVVTAAASTIMGTASIPSAAWPTTCTYPTSLQSEAYTSATCHYQPNMSLRLPYPTMANCIPSTGVSSEIGGYYCTPSLTSLPYSQTYSPAVTASSCSISCPLETCLPTTSINSTSLTIRREESPDSGYGGVVVEPTGSPVGSPAQICPSPEMQGFSGSPCGGIPSVSSCCDPIASVPTCTSSVINTTAAATTDEDIVNLIGDLEDTSPLPRSPSLSPPPPNQLNVTIYYGSVAVLSRNITCTKGCRLFYGPNFQPPTNDDQAANFESLFGPLEAEQISLPPDHPTPQASEIFNSMNRGLLIEMHDNDIFATPLCNTMVFCGTSYYQPSASLERERRTKVFDYSTHFRHSLEQYSIRRGPQPDPHVIFSLGQAWGPQHPITQNCIFVVVTHIQAKHDLEVYGLPFPFQQDLFSSVPNVVDVRQASPTDMRAESFLNSVFQC